MSRLKPDFCNPLDYDLPQEITQMTTINAYSELAWIDDEEKILPPDTELIDSGAYAIKCPNILGQFCKNCYLDIITKSGVTPFRNIFPTPNWILESIVKAESTWQMEHFLSNGVVHQDFFNQVRKKNTVFIY